MKFLLAILLITSFFRLQAQRTVGVFQNDSNAYNGYTLLANLGSTETHLIDNCGNLVNSWINSTFRPGPALYLLNDGSLLKSGKILSGNRFIAGGSGGRLERYDWNDSLIWSYNFDSPTERQHHDIIALANGNYLVLAWDLITKSQAIADGLDTTHHNDEIWSEKVTEIQPLGNDSAAVVWEWRLWDHVIQDYDSNANNFGDVSLNQQLVDLNYANNNGISRDYFHANGLDYNPILDQIIISVRNYDEFWIIDHSTTTAQAATDTGGLAGMGGDILYRWGNPETYQQGTLADKKLFGQHNPNWIPQGYRDQGKIIVFNNGFNDTNQTSRVQIINPPVLPNGSYTYNSNQAFGPVNPDWTYTLPNFVDFVSGAQRLANGNTFITSGPNGHLYELDANDSIVWEYVSPLEGNNTRTSQGIPPSNNTLFRAYRYVDTSAAFNNKQFINRGPLESNPIPSACTLYPNGVITGVDKLVKEETKLKAYPNPIRDQLYIEFNKETMAELQLFDMHGQLIWQTNTKQKSIQIDCKRWDSGTYVLVVIENQKISTHKLIKL